MVQEARSQKLFRKFELDKWFFPGIYCRPAPEWADFGRQTKTFEQRAETFEQIALKMGKIPFSGDGEAASLRRLVASQYCAGQEDLSQSVAGIRNSVRHGTERM